MAETAIDLAILGARMIWKLVPEQTIDDDGLPLLLGGTAPLNLKARPKEEDADEGGCCNRGHAAALEGLPMRTKSLDDDDQNRGLQPKKRRRSRQHCRRSIAQDHNGYDPWQDEHAARHYTTERAVH
jgi:hypothetical protein